MQTECMLNRLFDRKSSYGGDLAFLTGIDRRTLRVCPTGIALLEEIGRRPHVIPRTDVGFWSELIEAEGQPMFAECILKCCVGRESPYGGDLAFLVEIDRRILHVCPNSNVFLTEMDRRSHQIQMVELEHWQDLAVAGELAVVGI